MKQLRTEIKIKASPEKIWAVLTDFAKYPDWNKDGTCTFIHGENFNGILISLFRKMLHNNTRRGFEMMNESLKERCER